MTAGKRVKVGWARESVGKLCIPNELWRRNGKIESSVSRYLLSGRWARLRQECESQHEGTEQSEGSGKVTESPLSSNRQTIVCGQQESQEQPELWKSREHFLNAM